MKKNIVLFVLFILPIVAYLFFASGIHSFAKLPIVTESIPDFGEWKTIDGNRLTLDDKITVLGFPGTDLLYNKGDAFNLNQKIYNKVREFKDFQLVMVVPIGVEDQTKQLKEELGRISDLSRWHYVFATPEEIKTYYKQLDLIGTLDQNVGTHNVFIVDKERNLRGRKGMNKKGEDEYKEGYNTISAADLHNEMGDDIKIILAEYRLALKKNNADRKNKPMKNKSYIGISFIILIFGIIFIPRIINRIKNDEVTKIDRLNAPGQKETSEDLLQKIGPVPKFRLTNQLGKTITNDDYLGKVYLVEFFFSTCPTICPKMNQNMLKLEKHFKDATDFGIVSITINPSYDTSEVLKSHAEHLGVTSPHWNFLTGNQDYIYEIANKGFNLYAAQNGDAEGGFEHSGLFALIDKKGTIRSRKDDFGNPIVYYDGLEDAGVEALKQDIQVLLNEK